MLSVLGIHTQDSASGDFSLSAPQVLRIDEGALGGRSRATISGNSSRRYALRPCSLSSSTASTRLECYSPAASTAPTSSPPESPRGAGCMDFGRGQGADSNAVVQLRGGSVTQRSAKRRVPRDSAGFRAGC